MNHKIRTLACAFLVAFAFASCSKSGVTNHGPEINPQNVPENLRSLIPMATKWGIGDDGLRDDLEKNATKEEKAELEQAIKGKEKLIDDWINSFPEGKMSDEAGAFMYMTLALEEM